MAADGIRGDSGNELSADGGDPVGVAVIGARGRMGALLCDVVMERDATRLVGAVDADDDGEIGGVAVLSPDRTAEALADADVAIEFSVPAGTVAAAEAAAATDTALVSGTTGLSDEQEASVDDAAATVPIVRASNYATGVNAFWELVEAAAGLLPGYDVEVTETHHRHKTDAPSGTALTAVERIQEAVGERDVVHGREGEAPRGDEIGVHARRAGEIVGEHEVLLAGEGESLAITHRAGERRAFAAGAVDAAEWVVGREPGRYGMDDVLGLGD